MNGILTWDDLNKFEVEDLDRVHGINNSYANLRLFGHSENDVLVTFIGIGILGVLTVRRYGYGLNLRKFHTESRK